MTILDRLESKFGRFAVPGLIRYVVGLNALVFILVTLNPGYTEALELDPQALRKGELWRAVTWIFIPETTGMFWIFFYLMFTWWIGDMLEQSWGTFRLNAYYLLGMVLCIASAVVFGASGGNFFLNLSLFLAVATLAPDFEVLMFLILPVKMKYVALFSLLVPAGYLLLGSLDMKMMVLMCLGNYLVFFGPGFVRRRREARGIAVRQKRFAAASIAESSIHRCRVCGATETTHPDLEFRVSSDGEEYCTEHLPSKGRRVEP